MERPVVIVIGTRPEAIKLLPVYLHLKKMGVPTVLCVTHQHRELLDDVLAIFSVTPDYALDIMKPGQQLDYLTGAVIQKTYELFTRLQPSMVVVQGDTTTALGAGLAAFYLHIPVAHIEAGLRTNNKYAPFPEEINRQCITTYADLHFAPTPLNVLALLRSGVAACDAFCVGNTVVDALHTIQKKIQDGVVRPSSLVLDLVGRAQNEKKRLVLLTTHRRESFDGGLDAILRAIKNCAFMFPDLFFLFPVHPNPIVRLAVNNACLEDANNIALLSPLSYPDLVYVLGESKLVITDSGGIQEEAVCLGKPVIILRDFTERVESIWCGMGTLVGTNQRAIEAACTDWYYCAQDESPRFVYGDGKASQRICSIIKQKIVKKEFA